MARLFEKGLMVRACAKVATFHDHPLNPASITLLALAMSTDAFAAAIGKGLALHKPGWPEALRTGLIFGVIEAITPVIGWLLGRAAGRYVSQWDHWIAFVLLVGIGLKMIWSGWRTADESADADDDRSGLWLDIGLAIATSIDALATGITLPLVPVSPLVAICAIGAITWLLCAVGYVVGKAAGRHIGSRLELIGGVILVAIGVRVLWQHL
jgi:putative Mn2+ efflux pump MntP